MNLSDFCALEMNVGKAYALGLIYPLLKYGIIGSNTYVVGCVNHNDVAPEDLASHFSSTLKLMNDYSLKSLSLRNNQSDECPKIEGKSGYRPNIKKGFSIFMDAEKLSKSKIELILSAEVEKVKNSNSEIKRSFAKGCFDGRSSWDTTYHLLAIDVDRNYTKQNLIVSIFNDINIDLNMNQREADHPKNDQLRVKKNCIKKFYEEVGFDSKCRSKIVKSAIEKLGL